MKKAYLVSVVCTFVEYGQKFRKVVESLGTVCDLGPGGFAKSSLLLIPDSEDITAKTISRALSKNLHPCYDGVAVVRLDLKDVSCVDYGMIKGLIDVCKDCKKRVKKLEPNKRKEQRRCHTK